MTAQALASRPSAGSSRGASVVDGEFPFTRADFDRIAGLLHEDCGIHLPAAKTALVYSRLAKRLRELGLDSFHDYCSLIASPAGAGERQKMMAALTTNVTRFFREPHHFDYLRQQVLAAVAGEARAGGRVRLWSAGCSTGEEPYSMALTVLSVLPDAPNLDVRILASDVDPVVVERGRAGVYSADAVEPIPADMRRWLDRDPKQAGSWRIGETARSLVAFRQLNLMADWPMRGKFNAIFCRNVAIYFDDATQQRIWERFSTLLTPPGRLYIGHSERVNSPLFTSDGLTAYRLAAGAAK